MKRKIWQFGVGSTFIAVLPITLNGCSSIIGSCSKLLNEKFDIIGDDTLYQTVDGTGEVSSSMQYTVPEEMEGRKIDWELQILSDLQGGTINLSQNGLLFFHLSEGRYNIIISSSAKWYDTSKKTVEIIINPLIVPSLIYTENGAKQTIVPQDLAILSHAFDNITVPGNYSYGLTNGNIQASQIIGITFGSAFNSIESLPAHFLERFFYFGYKEKVQYLDFSGLSNVTSCGDYFLFKMFEGCPATVLPPNFILPQNLINLGHYFLSETFSNSKISSLPSGFIFNQSVTYNFDTNFMNKTFYKSAITQLPNGFSLPKSTTGMYYVNYMSHTFENSNLISLPDGFTFPTNISASVYDGFFDSTFRNCASLTSLPSSFTFQKLKEYVPRSKEEGINAIFDLTFFGDKKLNLTTLNDNLFNCEITSLGNCFWVLYQTFCNTGTTHIPKFFFPNLTTASLHSFWHTFAECTNMTVFDFVYPPLLKNFIPQAYDTTILTGSPFSEFAAVTSSSSFATTASISTVFKFPTGFINVQHDPTKNLSFFNNGLYGRVRPGTYPLVLPSIYTAQEVSEHCQDGKYPWISGGGSPSYESGIWYCSIFYHIDWTGHGLDAPNGRYQQGESIYVA